MRRAGILLHPTSLPGPYGIGDIGPAAEELLAWLDLAGQRIWQMLPINPVDGGGCPYASPSAFARSPLLLSVDWLVKDGWLTHKERPFLQGSPLRVDWQQVHSHRWPAIRRAGERAAQSMGPELDAWAAERPWVSTWSLFRALQDAYGPRWPQWPEALRTRDADALSAERDRLAGDIRTHMALQWLFAEQWGRIRAEAKRREIAIWGDLPFFVGAESCDVWANPELFRVDQAGAPTVVSGVPPDAFSPTGQRWGHALYAEQVHRQTEYEWWCARLQALMECFDSARLDHFRGMAAVWEIPVTAEDATEGQWVPGPGAPLLETLKRRFGEVPLIAEDLGIITPDVEALRDDFELPGMAILEFAFSGDPEHPYLPHNHRNELVVYPGTHDNDTVLGWYHTAGVRSQDMVRRYLSVSASDISWDFIRCAYRSVADTAIVAMQDVLGLGGDARMNVPGLAEGNWAWRMPREALNLDLARRLGRDAWITGRAGGYSLRPSEDPP